jgi:hypothetical protein
VEQANIKDHLLPLTQSAGAFVLAEARQLDSFFVDNALVDVKGATEHRQPGHLFIVSRTVLEKGIDAYLEFRGCVDITTVNRFRMLEVVAGADSNELLGAQVLEMANPLTFNQVIKHSEACIDFVENVLHIQQPVFLRGYDDEGLNKEYNQRTQEVDALASHLGVQSPFPVTRLPRYIKGVTDPTVSMRDQGGATK